MKHMIFMNPPRRRRRRVTRRRARAISVNTTIRRNPPTRRKRPTRRRVLRPSSSRRMVRYRYKGKTIQYVMPIPSRRRSIRRSKVTVRSRRRRGSSRRSSLRLSGIMSKDNLQRAGGFILGGFVTNYVLSNFAASLPGYMTTAADGTKTASPIGAALWNSIVPIAAGFALKRRVPRVSEGLILGGTVSAIYSIIAIATKKTTSTVSGTKAYLDKRNGVAGYLDPRQASAPVGYDAVNAFKGVGASPDALYQSESAFKQDAWSR